jgi:hypothetical protein
MTAFAIATDRDFQPTIDTPAAGVWLKGDENRWARKSSREPGEPKRESLSDPEQRWLPAVLREIEHIADLGDNWDGYGAGPIRKDVLWYALRLLQSVMEDGPAPQLTPMSHEGVLLEWVRDSVHLEIEIEDAGEAYVSYEDEDRGIDNSWKMKANFASLLEPLRAVAPQPA